MILAYILLLAVTEAYLPEEAAQVQVIEGTDASGHEDFYIKVNGEHRDNGEEVYMQVNLNVNVHEGKVVVNDHILPFSELETFKIQAQICEISDGVSGEFEPAEVKVIFFLHEQTTAEVGEVARAFRLETQIIETDKYDVHMFSVTEVVMELDYQEVELRRTVTLISETESKLHAASNCPQVKCQAILGCAAFKKDENGCQTCQCAVMDSSPYLLHGDPCLSSCDGVCGDDPYTVLTSPQRDAHGCWTCPCLAVDAFPTEPLPSFSSCDLAQRLLHKFEQLPLPLRIAAIALLVLIALILTVTCCITVCCRKPRTENKTKNLKAFGFGKLQIYVPDNEKKMPLIDNLDVVSADIA